MEILNKLYHFFYFCHKSSVARPAVNTSFVIAGYFWDDTYITKISDSEKLLNKIYEEKEGD